MRSAETETSRANSATPRAERGIPTVPDAGLQPAPPPKLNGAGTRPPRLSRPSGRAERRAGPGPEAEGARRHLRRLSRKCAPRPGAGPSVPPLRPPMEPQAAGKARASRKAGRSRATRSARSRGGHGETRLERFSTRFLEATPRPGPAARPGARSPGCRRRRQRAGERQRLRHGPAGPAGPVQGCHPLPLAPPGPGAASAKSHPGNRLPGVTGSCWEP